MSIPVKRFHSEVEECLGVRLGETQKNIFIEISSEYP